MLDLINSVLNPLLNSRGKNRIEASNSAEHSWQQRVECENISTVQLFISDPVGLVRPGMDLYVSGLSAFDLVGIVASHAYATTNGMILAGFFDQIHVYICFFTYRCLWSGLPSHIKPPS